MDVIAYAAYPAKFEPADEGGFTVLVSGIAGAITEGDSKEEAVRAAVSVIADMANFYLDEKRAIPPAPPKKPGEELVRLPLVMALKIALRNEMLERGLTQRELARRLGMSPQLLSQTLDLSRTRTSIDALDAVAGAMGFSMQISLKPSRRAVNLQQ